MSFMWDCVVLFIDRNIGGFGGVEEVRVGEFVR